MPEIDYTPENRRYQTVEFDKLKLRKDERARIVLLEKPTFAWVHTLKAPKILNGEPVMVEYTRRGEKVMDYDMDFVGRPLCPGDYGTIAEAGLDEKNCPACARSAQSDEVRPPERRFATNAIRYKIKNDGSLVSPFSCDAVVWPFGEAVYNKLIEIANEHGTIIGKDLILGPCQNEAWQKYDILSGGQNVWTADERITAVVKETHENNRSDNLELACGRKQEPRWMNEDLDKISLRWRQARGDTGAKQAGDHSADAAELSAGLDELLAGQNGPDANAQAEAKVRNAPSAATPNPAEGKGEAVDFEQLLAGLNP